MTSRSAEPSLLAAHGWDDALEDEFTVHRAQGLIPTRVAAVDQGRPGARRGRNRGAGGRRTEPGCAVLAAVEDGTPPRRPPRLQRENGWIASRAGARLDAERRARRKEISRAQRRMYRERRRDRRPVRNPRFRKPPHTAGSSVANMAAVSRRAARMGRSAR